MIAQEHSISCWNDQWNLSRLDDASLSLVTGESHFATDTASWFLQSVKLVQPEVFGEFAYSVVSLFVLSQLFDLNGCRRR